MIKINKNKIKLDSSKNFIFLISSYNQSQFINRNLNSIRMQNYNKDKYKIVYVNDNSTDDSKNIIKKFISDNKTINIKLINNKVNKGPAYSRYLGYKNAKEDEICIFLDGDDWLVDKNTLKKISYCYSKYDIYATFGSMTDTKWQYDMWRNYDRTINDNYFPHLRTCYAFLCKKVPVKYLKYNKEWIKIVTDVALFTCIVELCNNKYAFIKSEFVYYNNYNNRNNPNTGFECNNKTKKQIETRKNIKNNLKKLKKLKPIV